MIRILYIVFLLAGMNAAHARESARPWKPAQRPPAQQRAQLPETGLWYLTEATELRERLDAAGPSYETAVLLDLPAPDGSFRSFRVWNTPVMEAGLAAQFPQIRSYTAEAVGAPRITAKLDHSPYGFHALVFDDAGSYFIEPAGPEIDAPYLVFFQKDAQDMISGKACGVEAGPDEGHKLTGMHAGTKQEAQRLNGAVRRTYRLALGCTGEYAVAVAGASPTKAAVMANLVGVVAKLNGVFEREFAVTMKLVANEANVIYLDGATDPYTNSSTSAMLGENQANLDNVIGSGNYDIGHALNVSGLGLGQLGCVCGNGSKAKGVTFNAGVNTYQIVAHEMGHQFSANHTFNGSAGSCSGNGVSFAAFEPGGGSTIMAYPGICASDNFQSNRDNYYHAKSLEDISSFIANSGSCATTVSSTNGNSIIPPFAATYAIPFKTPFELTAPQSTDATRDTTTWCWEERDLGSFGSSLALTGAAGPLFRTYPPSTGRTRVFPHLEALIGRRAISGEKLPDIARSLAFRVTERDFYQAWGAFNYPEDSIRLNVINTTVPFTVSYPAGGEMLAAGSRPAVRWNVAGTKAAPINCAKVDIYLSVDSGMTYPYLLITGTANDGVETVLLPSIPATPKARIKVKCSDNVFFNISGGNFTVYNGSPAAAHGAMMQDVQVSPVPADAVLQIRIPAALGTLRLRMLNAIGQSIWVGQASKQLTLDVSGWAPGVYQLSMLHDDGAASQKTLIIR